MRNKLFATSVEGDKDSSTTHKGNYLLLPLIVILLIVPLIVHEYVYKNQNHNLPSFPNYDSNVDFFLFYKSVLITIVGIILLFTSIYQHFTDQKKPKAATWFIPLAIYAIFTITSAIGSQYSSTVWNGGYEQFESTLILLTYCLLVYYSYINVRTENDVRILIKFAAIGIMIIVLLGVLQAIGLDLFRTKLGKMLISNRSTWSNLDSFDFQFENNRVYSTLYNPNYVGVYTSLIFPITTGYSILCKGRKKRIIAAIISLLLVICTFGAQSKTGLIVLIITSVILFAVLYKQVFKHIKILIGVVAAFIAIFFVLNVTQDFTYLKTLKAVFIGTDVIKPLQEIETTDEHIKINYNNKSIFIHCELIDNTNLNCELLDSNGNPYSNNFDSTNMTYTLLDPEFNNITVTPVYLDENGTFGCEVIIDSKKWYFQSPTESSGYQYVNNLGNIDTIITPESSLFTNYGLLFTGRGYLWSRSIPLLKNNWFIGTGADTFAYIFPQNDYVGKANYGFENSIVTKPHNMYLQIGIQTGIISLIAFIIMYLIYVIDCIKTYYKSEYKTFSEQIGISLLVGTIGYMISGIINDSTITVAPLFWTILGIGYACNRITRESRARIQTIRNSNK